MNKKVIFVSVLLGCFSSINAQDVKDIEEVTILGSRISVNQKELPQKIEVISNKSIENTMATDITDYLKKLASVNVVQYAHGFSYANVRGFAPNTFHGSNSIQPETSLLINGRPSGTVNLAVIDRNSIDRIEVLKGPSAAMYGANTMGGVINVITRKSVGALKGKALVSYGSFGTTEVGANVGGSLGEHFDFDFAGTFFNRGENYKIGKNNWLRNAFGWKNSIVTAPDNSILEVDDSVYDGEYREPSKLQYVSSMLRFGYKINDNWRVDVMGENYTTTKLNTLGDMRVIKNDKGERLYNTAELSLSGRVKKHHILAKAYASNEKSKTFVFLNAKQERIPEYLSYQSSVSFWGVQLKDEVKFNDNIKIVAGADYNDAQTELRYWNAPSPTTGNVSVERAASSPNGRIRNLGIYTQAHIKLFNNFLIVNPSFRTDFINYAMIKSFGLENRTHIRDEKKTTYSPNLGIQLNATKVISLRGNVGKAFRYSVANQLAGYYESFTTGKTPTVNITLGNPNLKDENSFTWDAGIKISNPRKGYYLDVTYFNTKVNDRIITQQDATKKGTDWMALDGKTYKINSYQSYINANYSKISGIEIDGYYDFGVFSHFKRSYKVFVNATKMLQYDDFVKNLSNPSLPDKVSKARHIADLSIGGGFEYDDYKHWNIRISTRYVGNKEYVNYNDTVNPAQFRSQPVEYPPHMTIDVMAGYRFLTHHQVSVRVSNLTDENYYEVRYQPMPGRFTSLRYTYNF